MPPRSFRSRLGARRQARSRPPMRGGGLRTMSDPRRTMGRMAVASFPDRVRTALRYQTNLRINPGVVTASDYQFAINDLFDPNVTGAGHQPRGFDNWSAIYSKYRVHSCVAEVQFRQRAAHGISCWLIPNNSTTSLTIADYPAELPRAVSVGCTGSSQPPAVCKNLRIQCSQILGVTQAQYLANENTSALISASPAERIILHVYAAQLDELTACEFEIFVTLTFDAEFFDRVLLGPSAAIEHLRALVAAGHYQAVDEDDDDHVVVRRAPSPAPSRASSASAPRRR